MCSCIVDVSSVFNFHPIVETFNVLLKVSGVIGMDIWWSGFDSLLSVLALLFVL